jgi:hypothetical protein
MNGLITPVLIRTFILGSESRGTHDHILFCHDSMSRATRLNKPREYKWDAYIAGSGDVALLNSQHCAWFE